jgi:hypothetical protein
VNVGITVVVQHYTAKIHPRVRFKTLLVFPNANANFRGNPAFPQKPPQGQRPLQAIRFEEKMSRHCVLNVSNGARGVSQPDINDTQVTYRVARERHNQAFPPAKPEQAQADPRRRERYCGCKNQPLCGSAQGPKSAPNFHVCFQHFAPGKVATFLHDVPKLGRVRSGAGKIAHCNKIFSTLSAGRSASNLDQSLDSHSFQQVQQVSLATLRFHIIFIEQSIPQFANGPWPLQQIPDARPDGI